ncbi:basic proline-rich protein-like [Pipra filicauda]|uniref:Basic proline-rich protein-like n=1 Tax=Pipra filicauda TaxID=649802 RepID=A0A7R5KXH8_9PASS|nr:basic proline-rich protein-like [Pipra filicauda]
MALSALWQRCVSWSSAIAQLLQPFVSRGTSCPTGSANLGQQPGQKQQPLPAPSAPPAGMAVPSALVPRHSLPPSPSNPQACPGSSSPAGTCSSHSTPVPPPAGAPWLSTAQRADLALPGPPLFKQEFLEIFSQDLGAISAILPSPVQLHGRGTAAHPAGMVPHASCRSEQGDACVRGRLSGCPRGLSQPRAPPSPFSPVPMAPSSDCSNPHPYLLLRRDTDSVASTSPLGKQPWHCSSIRQCPGLQEAPGPSPTSAGHPTRPYQLSQPLRDTPGPWQPSRHQRPHGFGHHPSS